MSTDVSEVQPSKASGAMFFTLSPISIPSSQSQSSKVQDSITLTMSGTVNHSGHSPQSEMERVPSFNSVTTNKSSSSARTCFRFAASAARAR